LSGGKFGTLKNILGVFIKEQEENIKKAFKELEDSFMYLGVLKKMALPMAMMLLESNYDNSLKIFKIAWNGQSFPPHEELFSTLNEDYGELTKMANADDVIHPISDQMKVVFENLEQLRDAGMSWEEGKEKILECFQNRG
ncbi:MAG: hypothetical protein GY866_32840, partial [Proteobacteria bacterium]|nr:hypothetical protein [Pseudomonadota bacterium]